MRDISGIIFIIISIPFLIINIVINFPLVIVGWITGAKKPLYTITTSFIEAISDCVDNGKLFSASR